LNCTVDLAPRCRGVLTDTNTTTKDTGGNMVRPSDPAHSPPPSSSAALNRPVSKALSARPGRHRNTPCSWPAQTSDGHSTRPSAWAASAVLTPQLLLGSGNPIQSKVNAARRPAPFANKFQPSRRDVTGGPYIVLSTPAPAPSPKSNQVPLSANTPGAKQRNVLSMILVGPRTGGSCPQRLGKADGHLLGRSVSGPGGEGFPSLERAAGRTRV
jgi:hypothetical protein